MTIQQLTFLQKLPARLDVFGCRRILPLLGTDPLSLGLSSWWSSLFTDYAIPAILESFVVLPYRSYSISVLLLYDVIICNRQKLRKNS